MSGPWIKNNNNNRNRNNRNNPANQPNQNTTAPPPTRQLANAMSGMSLSGPNNTSSTSQTPALTPTTPNSQAPAPTASASTGSTTSTSQATASTKAKLPFKLQGDGQPIISAEDKDGKDPTYHDERYATSSIMGEAGDFVNIRVNIFSIDNTNLPGRFGVYSVALPQINARPVTKRHIKKLLMQGVLSPQQPWGQAFANGHIFTDWDGLIVANSPGHGLPPPSPPHSTTNASFLFRNQSAPPNTPAQTVTATLTCLGVVSLSSLGAYLIPSGVGPPDFNYNVWMRIFNMMVKHFAAQANNTVLVGGNKVFPTMAPTTQLLRSGLQARQGFFCSVRPVNSFVQLQLNTVVSAFFPPGKLIDFLRGYFGNNLHLYRTEIEATIRGLKVRYMYTLTDLAAPVPSPYLPNPGQATPPGRLKTCNALSPANRTARTTTFTHQQTTWTVERHFNTNVLSNYTIQYPHLPLVNVGPKSTRNNPNQEVWIPVELLWIEPDQALRSTVPETDMPAMARHARRLPLQNVALLEGFGMQILQTARLASQNIIHINGQLLRTLGRLLPIPTLQYRNENNPDLHRMRGGKWDLIKRQFHTGAVLPQLLVIRIGKALPSPEAAQLQRTLNGFAQGLHGYGVKSGGDQVPAAQVETALNTGRNHMSAAYSKFRQPAGGRKIKTVLVILQETDQNAYAEVKTWGELVKGVNTVCVTDEKVKNSLFKPEFQGNLALKFNAKLGGLNHVLGGSFQEKLHYANGTGTMVVGADVTHPGPSSIEYCPSIAAVVASEDKSCVRFPGSMRLQAGRTEIILGMEAMMKERLCHWKANNGDELPDSILYYRDGVSESQFAMIKQQELTAIKAAYTAVGGEGAEVFVTVVVCTKRHQTRFYPASDKRDARFHDNKMNFKTGLVVDRPEVRAPHYFDFYLQGHNAIQGTARPCHYFVIDNGMEFDTDDLQQITYGLSWAYATSLTPISLAAPAYYADKLCERGRAWLRPLLVRGHGNRPPAVNFTQQQNNTMTDAQKSAHVAHLYATGQNPGQIVFWPNNGLVKNPCHDDVADSMFYV